MPVEDICFTSGGYSDERAFAEYAQLYAYGADTRRMDGPFHANIRGWRLDGILLFDREIANVEHIREERVVRDGVDHIVATLVVSGELHWMSGQDRHTVASGDIVFYDTKRSHRASVARAHLITAALSRDLVEAAVGTAGPLHSTIAQPPVSLPLADYMTSLVVHAPHLDLRRSAGYARAFAELLSATLARDRDAGADARRHDYLRRQAVERVIATAIADPELTSHGIAERTGMSRSTLYRLLEGQGGVTHLIARRRADAIRRALETEEDVAAEALCARFGFGDVPQMERAFARTFGQSIADYRASIARTRNDAAETSRRRWRGWMGELQ